MNNIFGALLICIAITVAGEQISGAIKQQSPQADWIAGKLREVTPDVRGAPQRTSKE